MSADNWDTCPRCKLNAEAEHKAQMDRAVAAYGKAPAEEYERLVAAAREPLAMDTTLREDYEQGIMPDGKFFSDYSAVCTTEGCGFKYTHNYEEQAQIQP